MEHDSSKPKSGVHLCTLNSYYVTGSVLSDSLEELSFYIRCQNYTI